MITKSPSIEWCMAVGLNDYCNRYNHQFHEAIHTTNMSVECETDLVVSLPYHETNIVVTPPLPLLRINGLADDAYLNLLDEWNECTQTFVKQVDEEFKDVDLSPDLTGWFNQSYSPMQKFSNKLLKDEEEAMHKEAEAYDYGNGYRNYTDMLRNIAKENENGRLPISKSNEAILAVYDKYAYIYRQVEELT